MLCSLSTSVCGFNRELMTAASKRQASEARETFESRAKPSRIKSVMKWWSKCISMVIASRNVAFKSDKLVEALFQEQSVVQTRQLDMERRRESLHDADFEGLARNAGLYIFNQDDSQE